MVRQTPRLSPLVGLLLCFVVPPLFAQVAPSANKEKTGTYAVDTDVENYKYFVCVPKAYDGKHAAGIHLWDAASGEFNAPFVRSTIPDRTVVLVNLGTWEEGLLVQAGNPRGLLRCQDLAESGIRLVNREKGAGSRLLLDTELRAVGVPTSAVVGYDWVVGSHQEVAGAVASGNADAGVSTAAVAAIFGLGFVPIRQVRYDLALIQETVLMEPIRQLLSTLEHRWVRSQLEVLGGYDTTLTGTVTMVAP